jgi:hypothetical protein
MGLGLFELVDDDDGFYGSYGTYESYVSCMCQLANER